MSREKLRDNTSSIAWMFFLKKKKKSDLKNFRIELTPPSNIKEIMELEYTTNKMNLIQAMNATGLFPKKFTLQYVMKMTKKEIDNLTFFKDLEMQANQAQENGMIGGMMGAGGMGMDTNAAPADTNPAPTPDTGVAPTASINTESLEKNLIKIFGKDILIENKEDFVKLIKAAEDYNNSLTEEKEDNKKETINEEVLWEELVNKTIKKTPTVNERATSMIYENELGGLNYDKKSYCIFEEPKKRTGPKSGSNPFLYEEITHNF